MCVCVKMHKVIHFKHAQFIACKLYLKKVVKLTLLLSVFFSILMMIGTDILSDSVL